MIFNKKSTRELKEYIFKSSIHDAVIETLEYVASKNMIIIKTNNHFYNQKSVFSFKNVLCVIGRKGDSYGAHDTIASLTVEEDDTILDNCSVSNKGTMQDALHLLFQMFSGDEINIVAEELDITTIQK